MNRHLGRPTQWHTSTLPPAPKKLHPLSFPNKCIALLADSTPLRAGLNRPNHTYSALHGIQTNSYPTSSPAKTPPGTFDTKPSPH
ncbi:hypothetical protein R3P38DRAFT_3168493 [Favolaschia claudopus]|uniref:Uncharacterized protein n=1 Tax=Favolaschia claudopus TaxID=2862362 RepID=A0AAW0E8F8_9AGAR